MLLFSLPGTPFIYYGEELGMHGAANVDTSQTVPWSRNPMQWDATSARGFTTGTPWTPVSTDTANVAAQVNVAGSMLETYKGLIGTRKGSPALQHGGYREVPTDRTDVFAFVREDPAERVLVVASFGHAVTETNLDLASLGITSAIATERIFGGALPAVTAANAAAYGIALPASGAIWILLK
jgi:glycosidase